MGETWLTPELSLNGVSKFMAITDIVLLNFMTEISDKILYKHVCILHNINLRMCEMMGWLQFDLIA